jgi:proline racemase
VPEGAGLFFLMNRYKTIDAHVAGESVRLLIEGAPRIVGRTMDEKLAWLKKHGDALRRTLMLEPRGHAGMHGALFTEPVLPRAHAGLLSMHAGGFPLVSGEGVMAAAAIAVAHDIIVFDRQHSGDLLIETPAGLLTAYPQVVDREDEEGVTVGRVALTGLPSFVHSAGVPVRVGNRSVRVDVAFGGEFFAIADSEGIGVPVDIDHAPQLLRAGLELKQAVESLFRVAHPDRKTLSVLHGVILTAAARGAGDLRSATILEGGVLRRSPGVTGTAALLAVLDAMGLLQGDRPFVHEGLVGTVLSGRIVTRYQVEEMPVVMPLIEGDAWITGRHEFSVERDDAVAFRI